MDPVKPAAPGRKSWLKLILFGVVSLLVLLAIAGSVLMSQFGSRLYAIQWVNRIHEAMEFWQTDTEKAKQMADQTFIDAKAQKLPVASIMAIYREYAMLLYGEDEKELGDEQLAKAISLCPPDPPPNSSEGDQLTHAYQARGWDSHLRFLNGTGKDPGEKDQEMSVAVSEKTFGPDHEQTIYKIPTLALIYADLNKNDKAEQLMQRALTACNTKASAKECAWFVYSLLSRMRGVEHDYKAATAAYLDGRKVAINDDQRDRLWDDYTTGLNQGRSDEDEATKVTEALIAKEKFAELDQLGDRYRTAKTANADGFWQLDRFYTALDGGDSMSENKYQQRLVELKKWLAGNPHSIAARVAIAQCDIYGAWSARLGNNPNGANLFKERIKEAEAILNADASIRSKCPKALVAHTRLVVATSGNKEQCMKVVQECHTKWPTYYCIDTWGHYFLKPQWLGSDQEADQFIITRSNQISGAKGDEEFARLVWWSQDDIENLFSPNSPIKWQRVKAGFKEIFKEFPKSMDARIAYLRLAFKAHDEASVRSTFDSFPPSAAHVNSTAQVKSTALAK